jgi:hypothetical protein
MYPAKILFSYAELYEGDIPSVPQESDFPARDLHHGIALLQESLEPAVFVGP